MTITEEQIAGRSPLRLKIVEVGRSDGPPDFLIADEDASEVSVMMGTVAVYAQVADRRTAEIIVKSVHEYPALLSALEAQAAELAEVRQQYVDANEARIDAEAQLAERGKPFIAAAEEAYWLLAWTWQSHLTGPGKPFDMSIFAPEARNMMTKAEQDLFDALSEIEP